MNEAKPEMQSQLTNREFRQLLFSATLTALGIGLVMSAVIVAFVLFCVHVWLK